MTQRRIKFPKGTRMTVQKLAMAHSCYIASCLICHQDTKAHEFNKDYNNICLSCVPEGGSLPHLPAEKKVVALAKKEKQLTWIGGTL